MANDKLRIVTSASLFDGHDAAINIMRRILQSNGAEVIHLGHDRSVKEIVNCAIQEDANAIALTSYQGGHMEFFKYMYDLLKEKNCEHIKIFGGGGGTILPTEIEELHRYGIARIYSPDDGRKMGLEGMIKDLLSKCESNSDLAKGKVFNAESLKEQLKNKDWKTIGQLISLAENSPEDYKHLFSKIITAGSSPLAKSKGTLVLGITGTGGAGKSSLVDELVRRFLQDFKDKTIAIVSVDPSKRKTGGALLGDRIRMNAINNERVYMRSLATRQSNLALSKHVQQSVEILKAANYDLIILETSGIGQSDTEITDHSDVSLYVMTPEYGAATQLEKIDMLDFADFIAINKFDKKGAEDALRDVKKQFKRNHNLWGTNDADLPVFGTIASQFNDYGMNMLYKALMDKLKTINPEFTSHFVITNDGAKPFIIPPQRIRYLSEITENNRGYDTWVKQQKVIANQLYSIINTMQSINGVAIKEIKSIDTAYDELLRSAPNDKLELLKILAAEYDRLKVNLAATNKTILQGWKEKVKKYKDEFFTFKVRDTELKVSTHYTSLSYIAIPKVAIPRYESWGDILEWCLQENVPGEFPYTAGVFPFKREGEDPARMFAGEGGPERTNHRFHYLSSGLPAHRLSTAFDSVTLY